MNEFFKNMSAGAKIGSTAGSFLSKLAVGGATVIGGPIGGIAATVSSRIVGATIGATVGAVKSVVDYKNS